MAAAGPCLAAQGVGAVLWARGPGSPPGHQGQRDSSQTTRGEDGDSLPLAVLCFHSLQVLHLQPWALHPRGFNGKVRFACFIHSLFLEGLVNSTES